MQQFYKYLILVLLVLHVSSIKSKTASLWVGESTTFVTDKIDVPIGWDYVITTGFVWNISENTKQYISMGTSGMDWNTVTLNKFFHRKQIHHLYHLLPRSQNKTRKSGIL